MQDMCTCVYTHMHACIYVQVNFYEGPPFKFKGTAKTHERFVNVCKHSPDGSQWFIPSSQWFTPS